jgi:hypothetical protein
MRDGGTLLVDVHRPTEPAFSGARSEIQNLAPTDFVRERCEISCVKSLEPIRRYVGAHIRGAEARSAAASEHVDCVIDAVAVEHLARGRIFAPKVGLQAEPPRF